MESVSGDNSTLLISTSNKHDDDNNKNKQNGMRSSSKTVIKVKRPMPVYMKTTTIKQYNQQTNHASFRRTGSTPSSLAVVRFHHQTSRLPKGGLPQIPVSSSICPNPIEESSGGIQKNIGEDNYEQDNTSITSTANGVTSVTDKPYDCKDDEFDDIVLTEALQQPEFTLMSCDTYLLLQKLQNLPDHSIEIPLLMQTLNEAAVSTTATSSMRSNIRGVLECCLHEQMQQKDMLDDTIIAQELNYLLRTNVVRRLLSNTHNGTSLNLIIMTDDYIIAVQYAASKYFYESTITTVTETTTASPHYYKGQHQNQKRKQQEQEQEKYEFSNVVLKWFINHLKEWTGKRITEHELQGSWVKRQCNNNDTFENTSCCINSHHDRVNHKRILTCCRSNFPAALQLLLQWKVLMNESIENGTYQLWLPNLGLVLKAWDTARTKIISELKRSYSNRKRRLNTTSNSTTCSSNSNIRGERSYTSLHKLLQYNNPIPLSVLLPFLVSDGTCVRVQRPSGLFIQLSQS